MPARPLFVQLSCSICWTVKFTFVLFQPTYTMQVYEVGATKLQCLLLSDIEITQQSYRKTLWQSIPTVLRHVHKHLLLTFQNHPHSLHTAPREVLGWVWMDERVLHFPNTLYNQSLLVTPKEYMINILNNKLENKTVLQRTSWTVQRKLQFHPPEKLNLLLDTWGSEMLSMVSIPTIFLVM